MLRVVKLGGSLLLRPTLCTDLDNWLRPQPKATNLFIVGGGEIIEAVRHFDDVHHRRSKDVHWQCVHLLSHTYQFVASLFPHWIRIETDEDIEKTLENPCSEESNFVVKPSAFYRPDSDFGLPCDWQTTTDSIAAALSIRTSADELVILKSCQLQKKEDVTKLISLGIIDRSFGLINERIERCRIETLHVHK